MTNPEAELPARGPAAHGFVDGAFTEVLAGARVLITAQRRAEDLSAALRRRGAGTVIASILGVEHHIDEAGLLGVTRDLIDEPPDCVVVCVLAPLPAMPASAFVVAPFNPIDAFHARNAGFCAASCAAAASAIEDPAILARFPKSPLFAEAFPCAFAHCCCARFACWPSAPCRCEYCVL